jgi:phosphate-selective porin
LDLTGRIQWDSAYLGPGRPIEAPAWELHRWRVGVNGYLGERGEFQVEYEPATPGSHPWRDVWAEWRFSRHLRVRAGRTKIPFGMDQVTPIGKLDFIERSRIGDLLAPARDTGVLLQGKIGKPFEWQAGAFAGDGDNARGGRTTWATHLNARIFKSKRFGTLDLGGAGTLGWVSSGLNSGKGETQAGEVFFPRLYLQGWRKRAGSEASWDRGRLHARFEYAWMSEQRRQQSILARDLLPLITNGWYVSTVYDLVRQRKRDGWRPKFPGGLELAVRYEEIGYGGGAEGGRASSNPRAATILANHASGWTTGVNWRPQRNVLAQANLVRERADRPEVSGVTLRQNNWLFRARLQLFY